jgi:hypothetical protein
MNLVTKAITKKASLLGAKEAAANPNMAMLIEKSPN